MDPDSTGVRLSKHFSLSRIRISIVLFVFIMIRRFNNIAL